jgi:hypothetical protein
MTKPTEEVKRMSSETDEAPLTKREAELARAFRTIMAPETPETPPAAPPPAAGVPAAELPPAVAAAAEGAPRPLMSTEELNALTRDEALARLDEVEAAERAGH